MTYAIAQAKLIIAYKPSAVVEVVPGDIETAWRASYPTHAADVDDACLDVLGTTSNAASTLLAAREAIVRMNIRLGVTGAGHANDASGVDANLAAYKPGSGGSHGGSTWLRKRTTGAQWVHSVTVDVGGTATTYACYPSVYVLAV